MNAPTARLPGVILLAGWLLLVLAACGAPGTDGPLPAATVPAGPDEWARELVTGFMEARVAGDEAAARLFLSPTADQQFATGGGGLTLTAGGAGFASWALLALEAADASSFEVRVRVEPRDGEAWEELLFVGVGPGPDGETRDLTIRGAQRLPAPA